MRKRGFMNEKKRAVIKWPFPPCFVFVQRMKQWKEDLWANLLRLKQFSLQVGEREGKRERRGDHI